MIRATHIFRFMLINLLANTCYDWDEAFVAPVIQATLMPSHRFTGFKAAGLVVPRAPRSVFGRLKRKGFGKLSRRF
jgi:hypothetical protein